MKKLRLKLLTAALALGSAALLASCDTVNSANGYDYPSATCHLSDQTQCLPPMSNAARKAEIAQQKAQPMATIQSAGITTADGDIDITGPYSEYVYTTRGIRNSILTILDKNVDTDVFQLSRKMTNFIPHHAFAKNQTSINLAIFPDEIRKEIKEKYAGGLLTEYLVLDLVFQRLPLGNILLSPNNPNLITTVHNGGELDLLDAQTSTVNVTNRGIFAMAQGVINGDLNLNQGGTLLLTYISAFDPSISFENNGSIQNSITRTFNYNGGQILVDGRFMEFYSPTFHEKPKFYLPPNKTVSIALLNFEKLNNTTGLPLNIKAVTFSGIDFTPRVVTTSSMASTLWGDFHVNDSSVLLDRANAYSTDYDKVHTTAGDSAVAAAFNKAAQDYKAGHGVQLASSSAQDAVGTLQRMNQSEFRNFLFRQAGSTYADMQLASTQASTLAADNFRATAAERFRPAELSLQPNSVSIQAIADTIDGKAANDQDAIKQITKDSWAEYNRLHTYTYLNYHFNNTSWNYRDSVVQGKQISNGFTAGAYVHQGDYSLGLAYNFDQSGWHEQLVPTTKPDDLKSTISGATDKADSPLAKQQAYVSVLKEIRNKYILNDRSLAYAKVNTNGLNLVVGKTFADSYASANVYFGSHTYKVTRSSLFDNDQTASFTGWQYGASLNGAYQIYGNSDYNIAVIGGVNLNYYHQPEFNEVAQSQPNNDAEIDKLAKAGIDPNAPAVPPSAVAGAHPGAQPGASAGAPAGAQPGAQPGAGAHQPTPEQIAALKAAAQAKAQAAQKALLQHGNYVDNSDSHYVITDPQRRQAASSEFSLRAKAHNSFYTSGTIGVRYQLDFNYLNVDFNLVTSLTYTKNFNQPKFALYNSADQEITNQNFKGDNLFRAKLDYNMSFAKNIILTLGGEYTYTGNWDNKKANIALTYRF